MNNLVVPWNHQPSGIDYGNTARSYTCPAGKYARITAILSSSASARAATTTTPAGGGAGAGAGSACATSTSIFITEGDVVTVTVSSAISTLLINGNIIGRIQATADAGGTIQNNTGGAVVQLTTTIGSTAHANFHVEEYNVIT